MIIMLNFVLIIRKTEGLIVENYFDLTDTFQIIRVYSEKLADLRSPEMC